MPIGVTVSGEIVFPFQCKDFIDQHKAAKQDRVGPQERPDGAQEKATLNQPDNAAATPEIKVPETVTRESAQPVAKLDQQKAANEDRVSTQDKPDAAPEKAAATQPDSATPENKASDPVAPATVKPAAGLLAKAHVLKDAGLGPSALPKGPPGCAHFRTYDAESHTYLTFGGQRRPCL
jgi:hypothetical protein